MHLRHAIPQLLLSLAALGTRAADFAVGDLYLLSHGLPHASGALLSGIVRIDPLGGASSLLFGSIGDPLSTGFTFDPYRGQLLVNHLDGRIRGVGADGIVDLLANVAPAPQVLAARGDGIVYMQVGAVFSYLDAVNVQHPLLDEAGTGSFNLLPGGAVSELRYDTNTNSLITISTGGSVAVCSDYYQTCIGKIPLTPSGTQVAGPMVGVQVDVSSSSEAVVGSGWRADGKLLVVVDTNSNDREPRMLLFDPVTMAVTTFASNGSYIGAAAISAGSWSNVLGRAVLDDSFHNRLRSFGAGEVGEGLTLSDDASGYGVSSWGHSEFARLVEIAPSTATSADLPVAGLLELAKPHPNPFNPRTSIRFRLTRAAGVRAEILDARGRLVRELVDAEFAAGWHVLRWDGLDRRGLGVGSGVYHLRLQADGVRRSERLVLVR